VSRHLHFREQNIEDLKSESCLPVDLISDSKEEKGRTRIPTLRSGPKQDEYGSAARLSINVQRVHTSDSSLTGSTVHFHPSLVFRAQIVDSVGAGEPTTGELNIDSAGGFLAISSKWKYAPETTSAMMMMA
jgi:hypothetical protein